MGAQMCSIALRASLSLCRCPKELAVCPGPTLCPGFSLLAGAGIIASDVMAAEMGCAPAMLGGSCVLRALCGARGSQGWALAHKDSKAHRGRGGGLRSHAVRDNGSVEDWSRSF